MFLLIQVDLRNAIAVEEEEASFSRYAHQPQQVNKTRHGGLTS